MKVRLCSQIAELDTAHRRGAEMDALLAEKQKKLAEKEAYIIDLQLACGSTNDAKEVLIHNHELKVYLTYIYVLSLSDVLRSVHLQLWGLKGSI